MIILLFSFAFNSFSSYRQHTLKRKILKTKNYQILASDEYYFVFKISCLQNYLASKFFGFKILWLQILLASKFVVFKISFFDRVTFHSMLRRAPRRRLCTRCVRCAVTSKRTSSSSSAEAAPGRSEMWPPGV